MWPFLPNLRDELEAADIRHDEICDYKVEINVAQNIQSLAGVGRFHDLMAVQPKNFGKGFPADIIIVDKQNHIDFQDKQKVHVGQYRA